MSRDLPYQTRHMSEKPKMGSAVFESNIWAEGEALGRSLVAKTKKVVLVPKF